MLLDLSYDGSDTAPKSYGGALQLTFSSDKQYPPFVMQSSSSLATQKLSLATITCNIAHPKAQRNPKNSAR